MTTEAPTPGNASPGDLDILKNQLKKVFAASEFYRRKWKDIIRSESDIDALQSLADIERFPFTGKDELRLSQLEAPPLGLHLGVKEEEIVRVSSTSGTTGRPLYYALTPEDKLVVWKSWKNIYQTAGIGPGDRVLFALAMGGPYGTLYAAEALEWAGHFTIPAGAQVSPARFVQLIVDLKPTTVLCITNFALRLATYLKEVGIDPRTAGIRKFLVGGEPIRPVRDLISKEWDAEVFDMMGCGEAGMFWSECEARDGMHFVSGDLVHMELLDPDTLRATEPEEDKVVELVFSHLKRDACSLVRYRTHDLARITAMKCRCGRPGPRIEPIGRSDDMIKVRGANIFPAAIQDLLVNFGDPVTGNFRILLPGGERKFSTPLKLVVGLSNELDADTSSALKDRLSDKLRANLNVRTDVTLVASSKLGAALKGPFDRLDHFVNEPVTTEDMK